MEVEDDALARDAHTSRALDELAQRIDKLTEMDWMNSLPGKAVAEVAQLEEDFSGWYFGHWTAEELGELPFRDEYGRVLMAGDMAREALISRKSRGNQNIMRALAFAVTEKMPNRAAIAIIWRDRLTPEQSQALTAQARAAGVSFDDLL